MPTRLRMRRSEAHKVRLALRKELEERGFTRVRTRGREADLYRIGRTILMATCWTDEDEEVIELTLESIDVVAFGRTPDKLGLDYEVQNDIGKRRPSAFPLIVRRVLRERMLERPIGWISWWCDARGLKPIDIVRMAVDLQLLCGRIELIRQGEQPVL